MKLAIMQPYFFPYIGYWQLLNIVDRFVVYDDVNYIKRGWINRNRILINGLPGYITVPLDHASQNRLIHDISLQASPIWRKKLVKSIENAYRKAPFYSDVFPVIEQIICYETDNLSEYLSHQLSTLATFLGIKTELVMTSRNYKNTHLAGQERILDICRIEKASTYINPQGGQELYDTNVFRRDNIELKFITMNPLPYKQKAAEFTPYLSIIDPLMETGAEGFMHHLTEFSLS